MSRQRISKLRPKGLKTNFDGKIAGSYDLEETIGKGHFAVVKLARHVFTGERVAVKVIDKMKLDEVSKQHLFQEVICMKLVQHPNVVRLYEVIDTQSKLYLILEWGDGGDMYDYIMKHDSGLDENASKNYFKQIVQAINYCHQLHVVHRDLKPENVVFFEKLGIVKLTDFGFSNKYTPGRKLETSCGSLAYSAPEILLGDSYDAPAVDVWSLGVILFMLVCGEPPFQEANDSETLTMIMDCKYRFPSHLSSECRNLISKMLVREPSKRATLQEIVDHPWLMFGDVASVPLRPLISREHLSEDDHAYIVQRMVSGEIALRDDIVRALEKNAYNHITATYYLLAEGLLRRQSERAHHGHQKKSDSKPLLAPLGLSPRVKSADSARSEESRGRNVESLVSPQDPRPPRPSTAQARSVSPSDKGSMARRFSLIAEEDLLEEEEEEDEEEERTSCPSSSRGRSLLQPNEDSLSDDSDLCSSESNSQLSGKHGSRGRSHPPMRPLHSVRSSPQLLNQIHEESEGEDDMLPNWISPQRLMQNKQGQVLHKVERTHRHRVTAHSRGSSYSSSDTSDNDDLDLSSKCSQDKLKHRFRRRDSSDHSSDTDGPSGHTLGGGASGQQQVKTRHGSRDKNSTGRHSQKGKDKQTDGSTGRQNGSLLGKRESSAGSEATGQKVSHASLASNVSALSLNSTNSRSSQYKAESPSNSPEISQEALKDIEALNIENKARTTRIIQVRSKDFTDLVERFKGKDSDAYQLKEPGTKFRRRPKQKMKTDINKNGLVAHADCSLSDNENRDQTQQQNMAKTKCCSVI